MLFPRIPVQSVIFALDNIHHEEDSIESLQLWKSEVRPRCFVVVRIFASFLFRILVCEADYFLENFITVEALEKVYRSKRIFINFLRFVCQAWLTSELLLRYLSVRRTHVNFGQW